MNVLAPGWSTGGLSAARFEAMLIAKLSGVDSFWLYPGEWVLAGGKIATWTDHLTALIGGHVAHDATQATAVKQAAVGSVNSVPAAVTNVSSIYQLNGAFSADVSHTISFVWLRTGAGLTGADHIFNVDASSTQCHLCSDNVGETFALYTGGYKSSGVAVPLSLMTCTFLISDTTWSMTLDSSDPVAGPTITAANVTAPRVFGIESVPDRGIIGSVLSVVYAGGTVPGVHELHRHWARRRCGAP